MKKSYKCNCNCNCNSMKFWHSPMVLIADNAKLAFKDFENDQKKPNQKKRMAKRIPMDSGDGATPVEKGSEADKLSSFSSNVCEI